MLEITFCWLSRIVIEYCLVALLHSLATLTLSCTKLSSLLSLDVTDLQMLMAVNHQNTMPIITG